MPPMDLPHIFNLTPDALRDLVVQWGMPAFRAGQVLDWVYRKNVIDPLAMTNLAKGLLFGTVMASMFSLSAFCKLARANPPRICPSK